MPPRVSSLKPPAKTVSGVIDVPDKPGSPPPTPAPSQQGTSQLPKGSVFETKTPTPPVLQGTPQLPKGSIFETHPMPKLEPPIEAPRGRDPEVDAGASTRTFFRTFLDAPDP